MDKLKQYKTQIFNVITIFLILTFAVYPGLTTANTLLNILAGISLLLLLVWGGLALYDYVRGVSEPTKETGETELDYIPKKKTTRKSKTPKTK
jgi:hypothetical protein